HEYVEVFAKSRASVESDPVMFRETRPGYAEVMGIVASHREKYSPIAEVEASIRKLYQEHRLSHLETAAEQGETPDEAAKSDPWKGLYPYKRAEYRDQGGRL